MTTAEEIDSIIAAYQSMADDLNARLDVLTEAAA